MSHGTVETEIKLPVADARAARRLLASAGFRVSRRRVFEVNTVFDTSTLSLRGNGLMLRIREAGGRAILTYKGRPDVTKHKTREELETEIPGPARMSAILERLGFQPVFRYEKYRTEYEYPGRRGAAMVDETPVGVYVELEGTAAWIDRSARRLGFTESDYITKSYGSLYIEWCRERGIEPSNMTFTGDSSSAG